MELAHFLLCDSNARTPHHPFPDMLSKVYKSSISRYLGNSVSSISLVRPSSKLPSRSRHCCPHQFKMSQSTASAFSLDTPVQRPSTDITLAGKHVTIVGLKESHAPDIFAAMGGSENASLFNFLWQGPFLREEEVVEQFSKLQESKDPAWYAIVSNKTSKAIGYCSLMRIEPQHHVVEVGSISYSPLLQRTACIRSNGK